MKLSEEVNRGYEAIDGAPRFSHSVGRGIVAEVVDNATGQVYAEAVGSTEGDAAANALEAAMTAAKPLTKAQQNDPVYREAKDLARQLEEANAEIANLRAAKPKRGRPPKKDVVSPVVEEVASTDS